MTEHTDDSWNIFKTPDFVIVQYIKDKVAVKSICVPVEDTLFVRPPMPLHFQNGMKFRHKGNSEEYIIVNTEYKLPNLQFSIILLKNTNTGELLKVYLSQIPYMFERIMK